MDRREGPLWRELDIQGSSPITAFNRWIRKLAVETPDRLPDLRDAATLFVTSDSSGDHSGAPYRVLSVLLTDPARCGTWIAARDEIRRALLPDGRRMSFKQLRDRKRAEALGPWLKAADLIPGLCLAIAIERSYGSLFDAPAPLNFSHPDFAPYGKWPPATLEKACRLCHFIGLTVAAIAMPGQDVYWFGDQDEICANAERLGQLTKLFAWISSHYATVDLGRLRVGSTISDDGSLILEDLASIPDLVAGAVAEVLARKVAHGVTLSTTSVWPVPDPSTKTAAVLFWLGRGQVPLKRIPCAIESAGPTESIISFLRFSEEFGP